MKWFAAVLLVMAFNATASDTPPYNAEQDPRRLALVISNADYAYLEKVPSASIDAQTMESTLTSLGFQVTRVDRVESVATFEETVLPQFRSQIQEGDLIIVYFSGHGFAYGQDNYLAASNIELTVRDRDLADFAMAVDAIETYLAKRKPGMLLFVVDACRSIAGFVVTDHQNANRVSKGFARSDPASADVNTIVAYGSKLGTAAAGYADANKLSAFTEGLVRHLPAAGVEFGLLFNDVSADVQSDTGETQQPGLLDWSDSDLYLTPTETIQAQQREAWRVALDTANEKLIRRYIRRYSTSRHAAAARQWLNDHPKAHSGYTLVSPAAVEQAWAYSDANIGISRIDLGVGYKRTIASAVDIEDLSSKIAGIVVASAASRKVDSEEIERLGANLRFHDDLVVRRDLLAKLELTPASNNKIRIPAGAELSFVRFVKDMHAGIWMEATDSDDRRVYLDVPKRTLPPLSIGRPLTEILVPPARDSIPDLIERAAIQHVLDELKQRRQTPTWVSIAYESSDDPAVDHAREARASHALYLLKRQGIQGTRITTAGLAKSGIGESVRLRFFGY